MEHLILRISKQKRMYIVYQREMSSEYLEAWTKRRNTGVKVRWYISYADSDQNMSYDDWYVGEFQADNQKFIEIAKIIYLEDTLKFYEGMQFGFERLYLKELKNETRKIKMDEKQCTVGGISEEIDKLISDKSEEIEKRKSLDFDLSKITEKQLELAAELYFGMSFCPDRFYQHLFGHFPPETIVRTLGKG